MMLAPWPVLVVDDDEAVLRLSALMLGRVQVEGRALRLVLCSNCVDARAKLAEEQFAVAILDVVMESEHAGLDLVREMRTDPRHEVTPIVVRTGQPGAFPEAKILQDFRISDYWRKDDVQPHRIRASITGLIRGYDTALALQERVREREVLLREIHHRVKNNLQIISSLLNLQRDQMPDESTRALLDESVYRVRSMALIHEQLYGVNGLERIDFGTYSRALADSLRQIAPSARVVVLTSACPVNIGTAVPLGLILNEFITNALKYGVRPAGQRSASDRLGDDRDIEVGVSIEGDFIRVSVTDAGPGFAAGFDPHKGTGLGLQVVRSLVRQLRGELICDGVGGARFSVMVPVDAS